MHKLMASARKEFLLLIRDIGGIAILFVMPLILIVTITLIQDSTFTTVTDAKIPILVVNKDHGDMSERIMEGVKESNAFEVIPNESEENSKGLVFKCKHQLAIVIAEHLSSGLEEKVAHNVDGIMAKFGLEEEKNTSPK